MNNFSVIACDTDSIFFKKKDQKPFSEEEAEALRLQLNSLMLPRIKWEMNGMFKKVITVKAKNYILQTPDGKIKIKGSALKVMQKEPALKDFINTMINKMLNDETNYKELYESFVDQVMNIKDIKRWCARKTISNTTMTSERTNETVIMDAIAGTEYGEGDRVYLYYKGDNKTLQLVEKFDGDYSRSRLLKKLYDNAQVFDTILPVDELFVNYSLKRNYKQLEERYTNVPAWKSA